MSAIALAALVLLGTTACSRDGSSEGETAGTTTSHDSTTEASTTIDDSSESGMTSTETDSGDGPDDTTLSGGSFYAVPEDIPPSTECDPWMQDCPEGEKCVPYASTGGTWDANKCVPITGDAAPGEACNYAGVIEATDDCDGDGVCWNTLLVDGMLVGTCSAFCTGTPDEPQCDEGATCLIANQGSVTLCIQACDPLAQDCPDDLACTWVNGQFACAPGNDVPPNQPCDGVADCPSGSICVLAELVSGCAGSTCCTAFCSLSEPSCAEPTTECVAFFDDDPPAGYEDIGICVSP